MPAACSGAALCESFPGGGHMGEAPLSAPQLHEFSDLRMFCCVWFLCAPDARGKFNSSGIKEYRACASSTFWGVVLVLIVFFIIIILFWVFCLFVFCLKWFVMRLLKKGRAPSSRRLAETVMQSLEARWPCTARPLLQRWQQKPHPSDQLKMATRSPRSRYWPQSRGETVQPVTVICRFHFFGGGLGGWGY